MQEIELRRRFENELRLNQIRDESKLMAMEWQLEKARRASEIDFTVKEQARMKRMNKAQAKYEAMKKEVDDGTIDETNLSTGEWLKYKSRMQYFKDTAETGMDIPVSLYSTREPYTPTTYSPLVQFGREAEAAMGAEAEWATIPEKIEAVNTLRRQLGQNELSPQEIEQITTAAPQYTIGQIITVGGKQYQIVGFYPDGEPDVIEVNQ